MTYIYYKIAMKGTAVRDIVRFVHIPCILVRIALLERTLRLCLWAVKLQIIYIYIYCNIWLYNFHTFNRKVFIPKLLVEYGRPTLSQRSVVARLNVSIRTCYDCVKQHLLPGPILQLQTLITFANSANWQLYKQTITSNRSILFLIKLDNAH